MKRKRKTGPEKGDGPRGQGGNHEPVLTPTEDPSQNLPQNESWLATANRSWDRFWFLPRSSESLGVMRILVGSMLIYTHLVWTAGLDGFLLEGGMIPADYRELLHDRSTATWSHFDWVGPATAFVLHWFSLVVLVLFTAGWMTRVTSVLSWLIVVSYANRATGSLFGLDQINGFLTLYLAIGNSGGSYALDAWRRGKRNRAEDRDRAGESKTKQGSGNDPQPGNDPHADGNLIAGQGHCGGTIATNIATRLIQLHMCVVYLFAGTGKLQGGSWWNGEAIWGALASYEYQTLDMTWISESMWLVNLVTLIAVVWEFSYPFLIWPRLTRPVVLALAFAIHLGIGATMGMMTFGLIMIYGNLAFIEPQAWRKIIPPVLGGKRKSVPGR